MNIFKFRVIIDTEEDVFRDIEIPTDSTFVDFHACILRAFEWEGGEMASFYVSNENWDKGQEIPLMDMNVGVEQGSMSNTIISDIVARPDEKLIYVYDFLRMWCFYIELIEVKKSAPETLYPRISMIFGDAPAVESKEIDLFEDLDFELPGAESGSKSGSSELTGDPEIDEFLMDDDEDDPDFDNIDDLEGMI